MLRVIIIVMVELLGGCTPQAERPQRAADFLLVGVAADYPPFESFDSARGEIRGFDIDLISIICEANRWSFEIVPTPFGDLLKELHIGNLDIAISALTVTPERETLISFSDPYYLTGQAMVLPLTDSLTSDINDLRGKKVGVVNGTTGSDLAHESDGVLVFSHNDIKVAFTELSRGNLEVVINDQAMSRAILKDYPTLRVAQYTLNSEYYGIAMRSDDSVRLGMLNDALAGIMGGYTYELLHERWFGYPPMDIAVPDSIKARWPSD